MLLSLLLGMPPPYQAGGGDAGHLAMSHTASYSITLETAHQSAYGQLDSLARQVDARFSIRAAAEASTAAAFSILDYEPIAVINDARYSVLGVDIQSTANIGKVLHSGVELDGVECEVSCDEGSPYWIGEFTLPNASQFDALSIQDEIEVDLGFEVIRLIVDSKSNQRPGPGQANYNFTAISPVAVKDAPFAQKGSYQWPAPTLASEIVGDLLGPVEWQLLDWYVPARAAVFDGVTPLQAARSIVESIGGVIESLPDGTPVCRSLFPVSIPDYGTAAVDFELTDRDVMEISESIQPSEGINTLIIGNDGLTSSAGGADRLEYKADEGSTVRGIIRAYLGTERPVTLVHTGVDVTITERGRVQRTEVETVEFIEGAASLRYAPDSIEGITYKSVDLGAVVASGTSLSSEVVGYSLAEVRYRTTAWEWRVEKDEPAEVQFVLMG